MKPSIMKLQEKKILLIEDEVGMLEMLQGVISNLGYTLEQIYDGIEGLDQALRGNYELIIIDGNLPRMSGFDICKRLRVEKPHMPLIMLTSRSEEIDRVVGLELGADDYVTKPFSIRELGARIKGLIRRNNQHLEHFQQQQKPVLESDGNIVRYGSLTIEHARRMVLLNGVKVDLTAMEYNLLHFLSNNPGVVFTRDELMSNVWGFVAKEDTTVNVTICRLRDKIQPNPESKTFIHTVRGMGYKFM